MWILEFLPEIVVHMLLILSMCGIVAGFVLGMIPFVNQYKIPIQIISIIGLVLSVYLEGGAAERSAYEAKVHELEAKVAKAQAESAKVNTAIVTKILVKRQIVTEKGDEVIRYIDREVTKYDASCPIPDVVIKALNAAAQNKTVEETIDSKSMNDAAKPPLKLPKK